MVSYMWGHFLTIDEKEARKPRKLDQRAEPMTPMAGDVGGMVTLDKLVAGLRYEILQGCNHLFDRRNHL